MIYVFSFLGTVSFVTADNISDLFWMFIGLICQGIAIWGIGIMIFTVTNRRDESMAILRYQGREEDISNKYVPLGFWSLSLIALFWILNGFIWYWVDYEFSYLWGFFIGYIFIELAVLALWLYVLWLPETSLDFPSRVRIHETTKLAKLRSFISKYSFGKEVPTIGNILPSVNNQDKNRINCPGCGRYLISEKRKCPKCSKKRNFAWCPGSEDFITNCGRCDSLVRLSSKKCPECGQEITEKVECTCGASSGLRNWSKFKE